MRQRCAENGVPSQKRYHFVARSVPVLEERRRYLAAASEALFTATAWPRAPQPIRLRRAAPGCWAALRTPSRVLLAVGDAQHAALLHDRGPSKLLRQTAPQLELTGSAGLVVSQRLADAADGLREGPGRPSAARRPGRATARWRVELPAYLGSVGKGSGRVMSSMECRAQYDTHIRVRARDVSSLHVVRYCTVLRP